MSDTVKSPASGASAEAPQFTERDLQILIWAMQSLKSGPPEIDIEKLAAFANMSNPRSARNAWAILKKKLMTPVDGAPPTLKKAAASRKKAAKDDAGEDVEATPKKMLRKRANKEPEDSDASPKKKGRPAKSKPKKEPEEETSEVDSAEEPKPEDEAAMAEAEEEV